MTEIAELLKVITPEKVNKMKRTRFWGLVFLAFSAILIPNIDKVAAAGKLLFGGC